jgi:hypothetical protein
MEKPSYIQKTLYMSSIKKVASEKCLSGFKNGGRT